MPKARKNKAALSRSICIQKGNTSKQNELIKRIKALMMESWELLQGEDPLNHISSALAYQKKVQRKKPFGSPKWLVLLPPSLTCQINMIKNVMIPGKNCLWPKSWLWKKQLRDLWEQARITHLSSCLSLCVKQAQQAESQKVWTPPREERSFLGHLLIIIVLYI